MTSTELLPAAVPNRKAVVYIRQSTQAQVQSNLESQRRQYELVNVARQRGFHEIEVIDEDLGRSASGLVARPGFERLVAGLCAGEVGAVLCFDASRFARNGRDWHQLQLSMQKMPGMVDARAAAALSSPQRKNSGQRLETAGPFPRSQLGAGQNNAAKISGKIFAGQP
jgi:Resolvase, N terminal domain